MFDMSLTYILVALVAVILNNALVELLSLHTRISVGKSMTPFGSASVEEGPCFPNEADARKSHGHNSHASWVGKRKITLVGSAVPLEQD